MKFKAEIYKKVNNSYVKVQVKKLNPKKDETMQVNDATWKPDYNSPTRIDGNTAYFCVDIDGNLLSWNEVKTEVTAKDLDIFVSRNILKQLFMSIKSNPNTPWVLVIVSAIAGFGIGYIFGGGNQAPNIQVMLNTTAPITTPTIPIIPP